MTSKKRSAFTMVELLSAIAIIAVLTTIAVVFVGNYLQEARKTAARRSVLILNEALNEYRTLGGIANAHSLQGDNSITMNAAVLDSMIAGFTRFGRFMSFAKEHPKFAISALASSGQGQHFHFVLDEVELERWSGGPPPKSNQTTAVALTPTTYTVMIGSSLTFTASGGDSTGEYTWGGDEGSGTGSSKTITFSTAGTRTVTVYKAGDGDYNDSDPVTATITVGTGYASRVLAGQVGTPGTADGIGTAAQFLAPIDLYYHGGYLYVMDEDGSTGKARRINLSTNEVETLFPSQGYYYPRHIATDGHYVYIGTNNGVRRGVIGDSTAPLWINNGGFYIYGLQFFNGYLYYVQYGGDKLVRVDNNMNSTVIYADMHPGTTQYSTVSMTIADDGTIYFAQPPRIYRGSVTGAALVHMNISSVGYGQATLGPDGALYGAFQYTCTINRAPAVLNASFSLYSGAANSCSFVEGSLSAARYSEPRSIAFDDMGNMYVAEKSNRIIRKIAIE